MMHPLFGEWYRRAAIDPNGGQLGARWEGVQAVVKNVDGSGSLELVRCFLGLPWKDPGFEAKFRQQFLAKDAAFRMQDNDLELQVLAGACIAANLDSTSATADLTAITLTAAVAPSIHKAPIVPEIAKIARNHLFKRSETLRSRKPREKDVASQAAKLIEAVKAAVATNELFKVAQPLDEALRMLSTAAEKSTSALEHSMEVQAEETNMIWWVFGLTSRDTRTRFATLPSAFAAILAGKELADLTDFLPGPRAVPAYLDRCLDRCTPQKVTLLQLRKQLPGDWVNQLQSDVAALDLLPLHRLARDSADSSQRSSRGRQKQEQPSYELLCLADQMYWECLTLKGLQASHG